MINRTCTYPSHGCHGVSSPTHLIMQLVACWSRDKRMTIGILLLFTPGSYKAPELA